MRRIMFQPGMVLALLAGDKTETRRVVAPQPREIRAFGSMQMWRRSTKDLTEDGLRQILAETGRFGAVGDLLVVGETYQIVGHEGPANDCSRLLVLYMADRAEHWVDVPMEIRPRYFIPNASRKLNRSGRFMPSWAGRIYLEHRSLRVERLLEITEEVARAEGFDSRAAFLLGWDRINAARGYPAAGNPWVRVLQVTVRGTKPDQTLWRGWV